MIYERHISAYENIIKIKNEANVSTTLNEQNEQILQTLTELCSQIFGTESDEKTLLIESMLKMSQRSRDIQSALLADNLQTQERLAVLEPK